MEAILYAEIHIICMVIIGLLVYWTTRSDSRSTSELWMLRVLLCFLVNITVNLCFALFSETVLEDFVSQGVSFAFKTLYFISLDLGVFAWFCFTETELKSGLLNNGKARMTLLAALGVPVAMALANLFTHHLFYIDEAGRYNRRFLFHVEMGYLLAVSLISSWRLLRRCREELDPDQRTHLKTAATFPLCVLLAWLLSFTGESVPVIGVCVTVQLLCVHIANSNRQISMDKLTRVNNRQNLIGFMNYKLKNHDSSLYLLMMDVDYFKSINDTHGHLTGDDALVRVAGVLKKACGPYKKRPYIARYGGDEFIVVMEGTPEERDALCGAINDMLLEQSRGLPYTLHLSIGAAKHEPGMTPRDLIEAADAELYKIKRSR